MTRRGMRLAAPCAGGLLLAAAAGPRPAPAAVIMTVAGSGATIFLADGGAATAGALALPEGVAVDGAGNLYIADTRHHRVRKVDAATGIISTLAGCGTTPYNGAENVPADSATLYSPVAVAVNLSGTAVYVADLSSRVRMIDLVAIPPLIRTIAGTTILTATDANGVSATSVLLSGPTGLAVDASGTVYIADTFHYRIRRVEPVTWTITTVAGNKDVGGSSSGDGFPATDAGTHLNLPLRVAVDLGGNLYITEQGDPSTTGPAPRVRRVDAATGVIATLVNTAGAQGFAGDGGLPGAARLFGAHGIAVTTSGTVYIADQMNNRLRAVNASSSLIVTAAGTGATGFSGDGGPAVLAAMFRPKDVAADPAAPPGISATVYLADTSNHRIRKLIPAASLVGALAFGAPPVSVGRWVTVSLAVSNPGELAAAMVAPTLFEDGAGLLLEPVSGPLPAGPLDLAPGGGTVFVWTYSVSGAGTVGFAATATGTEAATGAVLTVTRAGSLVLLPAAALSASLSVSSTTASTGQWVRVTLAVTNTGGVNALTVSATLAVTSGTAFVELRAGPGPLPVTILPWSATLFVWTFSVSGVGTVGFSATATGVDSGTTHVLSATATGDMATETAAKLTVVSVALGRVPGGATVMAEGSDFRIDFTVSNEGDAAVVAATPGLQNASASSVQALPPSPVAVTVLGHSTTTWSWSFHAPRAGLLAFVPSVSGTDINNALAYPFTATVVGGLVQGNARLTAWIRTSATQADVPDRFIVTAFVQNTGGEEATEVLVRDFEPAPAGLVSVTVPPSSATLFLVPGQVAAWSWTLTAIAPGWVSFTVTVQGKDAVTGAILDARAISPLAVQLGRSELSATSLVAYPERAGLGELIAVTLTATDTGVFALAGVAPLALTASGDGRVVLESGPVPAARDLAPGQAVTFTWTYRAIRGGTVRFSGRAAGGGLQTALVTSNAVAIVEGGRSLDEMVVYPSPFRPGGGRTLKFRQMPPRTAVRVYTIAGELVFEGAAGGLGMVEWDGRNQEGALVSPGVYLCRVEGVDGKRTLRKVQVDR